MISMVILLVFVASPGFSFITNPYLLGDGEVRDHSIPQRPEKKAKKKKKPLSIKYQKIEYGSNQTINYESFNFSMPKDGDIGDIRIDQDIHNYFNRYTDINNSEISNILLDLYGIPNNEEAVLNYFPYFVRYVVNEYKIKGKNDEDTIKLTKLVINKSLMKYRKFIDKSHKIERLQYLIKESEHSKYSNLSNKEQTVVNEILNTAKSNNSNILSHFDEGVKKIDSLDKTRIINTFNIPLSENGENIKIIDKIKNDKLNTGNNSKILKSIKIDPKYIEFYFSDEEFNNYKNMCVELYDQSLDFFNGIQTTIAIFQFGALPALMVLPVTATSLELILSATSASIYITKKNLLESKDIMEKAYSKLFKVKPEYRAKYISSHPDLQCKLHLYLIPEDMDANKFFSNFIESIVSEVIGHLINKSFTFLMDKQLRIVGKNTRIDKILKRTTDNVYYNYAFKTKVFNKDLNMSFIIFDSSQIANYFVSNYGKEVFTCYFSKLIDSRKQIEKNLKVIPNLIENKNFLNEGIITDRNRNINEQKKAGKQSEDQISEAEKLKNSMNDYKYESEVLTDKIYQNIDGLKFDTGEYNQTTKSLEKKGNQVTFKKLEEICTTNLNKEIPICMTLHETIVEKEIPVGMTVEEAILMFSTSEKGKNMIETTSLNNEKGKNKRNKSRPQKPNLMDHGDYPGIPDKPFTEDPQIPPKTPGIGDQYNKIA